ncbi:hypothetical protein D3C84_632650 [compost metagenome]
MPGNQLVAGKFLGMPRFQAAVNGANILLHTSNRLSQARCLGLLAYLTVQQQVVIQIIERGEIKVLGCLLIRCNLPKIEIREGHATTLFQIANNRTIHCYSPGVLHDPEQCSG